ncbi:mitochondrial ribosomal protein L28 [Rhodnius prolixus]|uniref:Putative mitochondrial ribosomal protein n=1 Tax=Rhodnius prolixus TaxID=13249 RepID=R4FM32_RHOPR
MASGAVRAAEALKLYKFPKFDILQEEGAHLPESYKKFFREWKLSKPLPVHYRPPPNKWIRNDLTGEVKRVQDCPIPLKFPPESNLGIWGGEGVVKGFQKRNRLKQRVPHFWVPVLKKSAVYSEVLDKRMEVTVTERTIDLILQHNGFDNYLLQNKACDLQSQLALKLKKKILHALYYKELYPDDPIKREEIFSKYKHFLSEYTAEDIEWYGLSFIEALRKAEEINEIRNKPVPLKYQFRAKLLEELMVQKDQQEETKKVEDESKSWMQRLNPFSKTK